MTTSSNDTNEESLSHALQVASSLAFPMSMHAAVQLDVFEIIAKAGRDAKLSSKEIVAQLPTKNPEAPSMLDRILRVLASHEIVGCSVADDEKGDPQRLYSLTPVSKFFVRNEDGVSLGPFIALVQNSIDYWSQLKDAIIEGGVPLNRVYGMNGFEYNGTDPRINQLFNTAMINNTTIVFRQILDNYNGFEQIGCLVDVGGGLGITLSLITSKYPSIKGINFDLPHVIQHAPAYPGVEHVGGDMFESVPKGDAILLKWILHNWSDDDCVKLLKNCYNAIPEDGKVVVAEAVVPIVPEANSYSRDITQMDVQMMVTLGGKERTKPEFEALASKAGFSGIRHECFVCNLWVMEFFK
ncbi:caffeate O-methyltransferase 1, O-methyltransferase 1, O-methyltransferase 3 [Hibiscus trionum]|uniref:Caffeate O-methyltransferase 1, O-methyltransferase 1, O-methyltransferase 3 n=1 Tax=Hibiscus trionum TaxID=183268 RepID=A0A9W7INT1_HIBTR|nr:caffeate O-methyltransferase 1, O-methyltransferase 1, O-methyltransferase 3 [Hibiscus trionum]